MEKDSASFWAGIKKYEDILSRDPMAYSFAPLADIYRKLGLPDEAIAIARRGVALHPEFAAGQMSLALACLEKGLVDEARRAFEVVVRITPENLDAQRKLADIYSSAGNSTAAERCLRIAADLEPDGEAVPTTPPGEPVVPAVTAGPTLDLPVESPAQAFAEMEEEDLLDAEILELTDDLIEEESYTDETFAPFAAAPERPSLQAARETVRLGSAVAAAVSEPVPAPALGESLQEPGMAPHVEEESQPAVMTATIAELFISQGMIDKGVGVYRELLRENPDNEGHRARLRELTATSGSGAADVAIPAETAGFGSVTETLPSTGERDTLGLLEGWLSNIGRMRACRTESR